MICMDFPLRSRSTRIRENRDRGYAPERLAHLQMSVKRFIPAGTM